MHLGKFLFEWGITAGPGCLTQRNKWSHRLNRSSLRTAAARYLAPVSHRRIPVRGGQREVSTDVPRSAQNESNQKDHR